VITGYLGFYYAIQMQRCNYAIMKEKAALGGFFQFPGWTGGCDPQNPDSYNISVNDITKI